MKYGKVDINTDSMLAYIIPFVDISCSYTVYRTIIYRTFIVIYHRSRIIYHRLHNGENTVW